MFIRKPRSICRVCKMNEVYTKNGNRLYTAGCHFLVLLQIFRAYSLICTDNTHSLQILLILLDYRNTTLLPSFSPAVKADSGLLAFPAVLAWLIVV